MEKIAIIEMNEIDLKLVLMNVVPGGYYNVFDKVNENLKLGQSVLSEGIISSIKITETLNVLKMFRMVCENNSISKVIAVATSFIKEAKKSKKFLWWDIQQYIIFFHCVKHGWGNKSNL